MTEHAEHDPKIKAIHRFATIASLTERGGRVTEASSGLKITGLFLARVGDIVTYPDGSEAVIIDGAGSAAVYDGKPLALVGSRLSNGDEIVETLQTGRDVVEYHGKPIAGLFDSTYVPPPAHPVLRFAVRGATTARGGVLRKVSSSWNVSDARGFAASLTDFIEYPDGTKASIVSGVGLPDAPSFAPLAIVGSELDNGDVITDSPDRQGHCTSLVPVRRDAVLH